LVKGQSKRPNPNKVAEDEGSAKDPASDNGGSSNEEEKEEPKVTLSKKAKGKEVTSKVPSE
jgi:hypothetical protein